MEKLAATMSKFAGEHYNEAEYSEIVGDQLL